MSTAPSIPPSILIIGTGVFGLSTLHALLHRPAFATIPITLLESHPTFPPPHTASIDNTRIVRADYADPLYASLAASAQKSWRDAALWEGAYRESGLLLTADAEREVGRDYVAKAMENVSGMEAVGSVKALAGRGEVAEAMRVEGMVGSGEAGYVNGNSGWVDAEKAMRVLRGRVEEAAERRKGVEFVVGEAVGLVWDGEKQEVKGAWLKDGREVKAAMTILATGAWTGTLVDLRGVASARGMCMAYVRVSPAEERVMKACPVHLNMSNGMFFFPPHEGIIKVARHAYGYTNSTTVPAPLFNEDPAGEVTISVPAFPTMLPESDEKFLSDFLHACIPMIEARRPFSSTRVCWYLDSADGEFLIGRHPKALASLFMATAGSGHGYKFLPVLGERIVDVLDGTDVRENGGVWTEKWKWPEERAAEDEIWCDDGSRAGEKGSELRAALSSCSRESKM